MLMRFALIALTALAAPAVMAQAPASPYQAGVHYFPVEPAQPTSAPAGQVEVLELFSYACVHCAEFQPTVDKWKTTKPANATFAYMPVAWSPQWELFARAFYAAEALGVQAKTHTAFFNALHVQRAPIATAEDIAKWYGSQGVDSAKFLQVFNSFGVNSKIARSKQMATRYAVDGTPTVIVAGKYRITGRSAGGYDKLFELVNYLVAKEAAAAKPAG